MASVAKDENVARLASELWMRVVAENVVANDARRSPLTALASVAALGTQPMAKRVPTARPLAMRDRNVWLSFHGERAKGLTRTRSATAGARRAMCRWVCGSVAHGVTARSG
jgi:hypothetical protein